MMGGARTAGEFLAERMSDPNFVAMQQNAEAAVREKQRLYAEAARDLLADLSGIGVPVESMLELRNSKFGNDSVASVLVRWLPRIIYAPLARDVVATLAESWARPVAVGPLLEEFRRDGLGDGVRWAIGDALERLVDDRVVDEIVALAEDRVFGEDRGLVVLALARMKKSRARVVPVLLELLDDAQVAGHAATALGKLRAVEAKPKLEALSRAATGWVSDEAKKALRRVS